MSPVDGLCSESAIRTGRGPEQVLRAPVTSELRQG